MAILCLANSMDDLRNRLDNILVGTTWKGKPIYLKALNITGAMMALLRDALHDRLESFYDVAEPPDISIPGPMRA